MNASATLRGQAGVYTVSLTASGATQDTLTRTAYINVNDGLSQETVIRYTYDPLYRLTSATYSGAYTYTFGYGYDEVGNRAVQTRTITSTLVTTYTHDAANRLSAISNQPSAVVWDANGNLLQEGGAVYAYDFANRLISTTLGGANTQFTYNGDGIRLRLIEAGTLTTYTQDYAAPLPVVLQAKTGTNSTQYVYSLGTRPLAEYKAAWEYLLADPLGSVRQIADADGNVTLLKSYEPYGSVLSSQGSATSVFGYAGEQADTTGLIFLRARYYQALLGMFLSRDPWEGDAMRPGSMNGWNYTEENPANFSDPSGMLPSGLGPSDFETHYRYSCNCGWIDWEHAGNPALPNGLGVYNGIRTLYEILKTPVDGDFRYKKFYFNIQQDIPVLGWSGVEWKVYARDYLPDDQAKRVTLGMNILLSLGFEVFQSGDLGGGEQMIIRIVNRTILAGRASSFAVEDLTSDTIAMYRVLKGLEQNGIESVCSVTSADQSWRIYQENQDMIGANQNFSFWDPKYACETGGACPEAGKWPSEFTDIEPQWPEVGIWGILNSTIKYGGGFKDVTPKGMPPYEAYQLGLPNIDPKLPPIPQPYP